MHRYRVDASPALVSVARDRCGAGPRAEVEARVSDLLGARPGPLSVVSFAPKEKTLPMRVSPIKCLFATAMLLLPFPVTWAEQTDEVVDRCLYHMGEFGTAMVQACVDQELSAARALSQYPEEVKEIVARCTRHMQKNGWSMVKACADQDIEAAAALAGYAKEHEALVERCRTQIGEDGAAKVKACADREIRAREVIKKD